MLAVAIAVAVVGGKLAIPCMHVTFALLQLLEICCWSSNVSYIMTQLYNTLHSHRHS